MELLAIFTLTEFDSLTAELCDVETQELIAVVDDNPTDRRAFQDQVTAAAAALGHHVIEWDRSQLAS